jgi:transcriptional regulator with XRE-family HTH domain
MRLEETIAARIAAGGDYISLASKGGLRRNYIQQFVKLRDREPGLEHFLKMCVALDVSPIWVLTGVQMSPRVQEFLELLNQIPPEDIEAVLRLVRRREP